MVDNCERCSIRHICQSGTSACPDLWHGKVVTSGTRRDPGVQEEEPVDDQRHVWNYWPHTRQRRVIRDNRKYVMMTAPRRLQRGRNS